MKHKSTLKRGKRFRRHTRKMSVYGGMIRSTKPLSASAPEWKPTSAPPAPVPEPVVDPNAAYKEFLRTMAPTAVAIDCEMVGVKPGDTSALAHVAIVDIDGNQIYNRYVIPRGGVKEITHNRKEFSGITVELLKAKQKRGEALNFEVVKKQVHDILNGRVIVGHGLINDFKVLEYEPLKFLVWDTTEIPEYLREPAYPGARRNPYKLKELAARIGNNIQRANRTGHSPLEDARASMNLFRTFAGLDKVDYTGRNMSNA